jgi:hypothetical protein
LSDRPARRRASEERPAAYVSRLELVQVGRDRRRVLCAAFELPSGGEILFQLADEGSLRRGGVYWLPRGAALARAPRFDELFREVVARAARPSSARRLASLIERARRWALATRPRLTPRVLRRFTALGKAARRLDAGVTEGRVPADALVLAFALVFASEEERYPRPRYRGCDVAFDRVVELLGREQA